MTADASSKPQRVQLRRTKGWRKPAGAVSVARPTKWGNPIDWRTYPKHFVDMDGNDCNCVPDAERRRFSVIDFGSVVKFGIGALPGYPSRAEIAAALRGKDLACWCPLDQPCHADVLLEIANA
jgi:Domain of unknown function (DUF4326)